MNINTKEVGNCDSSLSYYKPTCIRIVLHINRDPISRGYVGCWMFTSLSYFFLAPDWVHSWFSRAISLNSCLFFTVISIYILADPVTFVGVLPVLMISIGDLG